MIKKIFLFFLVCFLACESNTTPKEKEVIITKQEKLERLFTNIVTPLFLEFTDLEIPNKLTINAKDKTVNAGAAHGYIEVSQGLIEYEKEHIQIYVLAHEISHIATLNQAKKFNLEKLIPSGKLTNDYKKSEYLADLIAIHLMSKKLTKQKKLLIDDFSTLTNLLGSGDYMHPSGIKRINMMRQYLDEGKKTSPKVAFKKFFLKIWNLV